MVAMNLFKERTNLSRFTLVAVPQIGQHTATIKEVCQFIRKNLCENTQFPVFSSPRITAFSNFMRRVKPQLLEKLGSSTLARIASTETLFTVGDWTEKHIFSEPIAPVTQSSARGPFTFWVQNRFKRKDIWCIQKLFLQRQRYYQQGTSVKTTICPVQDCDSPLHRRPWKNKYRSCGGQGGTFKKKHEQLGCLFERMTFNQVTPRFYASS